MLTCETGAHQGNGSSQTAGRTAMRRGGRESILMGMALLCLDISAAVIIVAWDSARDLSETARASVRRFNMKWRGNVLP